MHAGDRVPTAQGKQGKLPKIFPVRENTGNMEILQKHRDFFFSSCKFPDSKGKGYLQYLPLKFPFFLGLPTQFCVCNSHKLCKLAQGKFVVGQGKNRENTGDLKIQFDGYPVVNTQCFMVSTVKLIGSG